MKRVKRDLLKRVACASIIAAALSAMAHPVAGVDAMKAPTGGQVRDAGPLHLELVVVKNSKQAADHPVFVYVTDQASQKVSTVGAVASVTLMSGTHKVSATLQPDGDNRLKGVARYASTPDLKAIVSVTLAGKPPEQTRFTPLAPIARTH